MPDSDMRTPAPFPAASVPGDPSASASTPTSRNALSLARFLVPGALCGLIWLVIGFGAITNAGAVRLDAVALSFMWINMSMMLGGLALSMARWPYTVHSMHLLSLFLFLGAPALLQYSTGYFAVAGSIENYRDEVIPAVAAVFLWTFTYLISYEAHQAFARPQSERGIGGFLSREITTQRCFVVLGLAITTLLYLGFVVGLAGVTSRAGASGAASDFVLNQSVTLGGGLVFYLINHLLLRAFPFVALLMGILFLRRAGFRRNPLLSGALFTVLVGIVVADNPFASQRIWMVTILFAMVAPLLFVRMRTGWAMVVATIGGLTILPALSANRHSESFSDWLNWLDWVGLVSPLDYLSRNTDVDALGMTVLCVKWLGLKGYMWGWQTLTGVFAWVPRSIWPSKGIGSGKMVTEDLGFEFTNLSVPIVAEAVLDFGVMGVIPMACVLGLLFSKLDLLYWSKPHTKNVPIRVIDVIFPFWLGLMVLLTRGDLIAAVTFILAYTAWAFVLGVGGAKRRTPGRQRSDAEDPNLGFSQA